MQVRTVHIAETMLPTRHGNFRLRGYKHSVRLPPPIAASASRRRVHGNFAPVLLALVLAHPRLLHSLLYVFLPARLSARLEPD